LASSTFDMSSGGGVSCKKRKALPQPDAATRAAVELERTRNKARAAEVAHGQGDERRALRDALAKAATVVPVALAGGPDSGPLSGETPRAAGSAQSALGIFSHNGVLVTRVAVDAGRPPLPDPIRPKGTRGGVLL